MPIDVHVFEITSEGFAWETDGAFPMEIPVLWVIVWSSGAFPNSAYFFGDICCET